MKIGIDISCLQGPHRMRGIGYTAANILRNLPVSSDDTLVLYIEKGTGFGTEDISKYLSLDTYHFIFKEFTSQRKESNKKRGQVYKAFKKYFSLFTYKFGERKYPDIEDLDSFIQLDQSMPLPKVSRKTKVFFIAYDLIPYVLERDYLPNYTTCRQKGRSRRSALKSSLNRHAYIQKIRYNVKRADTVLAISNTTKNDFIRYAHAPSKNIEILTLGITEAKDEAHSSNGEISRFNSTSWGYLPVKDTLAGKNFILFVGGADNRRRLQDLVAAFNQLKARGSDLKLVLSGDIMKGPEMIPSVEIQKSLKNSSYLSDIYFVGFTDDSTRNWLYKNSIAFVFPSTYEGFGLPILEAMYLKTPVICYPSMAVREIAGATPFYVTGVEGITKAILEVQRLSEYKRKQLVQCGYDYASSFTWSKTAKKLLDIIKKSSS